MNNTLKSIIGVAVVLAGSYWIYDRFTKKSMNVAGKAPKGCELYPGSVPVTNGFIITNWIGGVPGVVVNNGKETGQTLVCPIGQTSTSPIS